MADEAAVLDAPIETAAPIDTGAQADVNDGQVSDSSVADGGAQSTTDESGAELRGSALWRDIKANVDAQRPLTPEQVKAVRRAIHYEDGQSKKYPDGLAPLEAAQQAVQRLTDDPTAPIDKVIEETLTERNYFRELDGLFTSGKSDFVDRLADAQADAFQQMAPAVFRKFAELNPEGYSAYVSQAVISHLNAAEVPLQFSILKAFLPQLPEGPAKEQVIQAVEKIFGSLDTLKQLASKPVTKAFTPPTQDAAKPENTPDQGLDLTRREWNLSVQQDGINMVLTEATRKAANDKTTLTEKEKKDVIAKVNEELEARLMAKKDYGTAMQGYLKNNNRSAYLQRIQSERKQIIPGATRRAVDDVVAARTATKPRPTGDQPATKPPVKPGQNQHTVQFRKIAGHPKTQGMIVDLKRTPNHMLLNKQAYVKGEDRPVAW